MEIYFHLESEFKCVYLLNGAFSEKAESFKYSAAEPIYVTCLPLEAQYIPYTVKIFAGRALSNEQLCRVYTLKDGHFYVKLLKRYSYVYSPLNVPAPDDGGIAKRLFTAVKKRRMDNARELMSEGLKATIDDSALSAFFSDYHDLVEDKFLGGEKNRCYLIDDDNKGTPFRFLIKGGLIDDITELE